MDNAVSPTETVEACPCCGGHPRVSIIAAARDLLTSSSPPGSFGIWKCLTCSSAYLSPRPAKAHLGLYYPEDEYLPMGENGGGRSLSTAVKRCLRSLLSVPYSLRFGRAEATVPPFGSGRLLEIGCGHGVYLRDMRRLGWQVYGCDISRRKVDRLQREFGDDRVFCGRIEDLSFAPESFDLVALWHVIEHLHEPGAALERIRGLLRPGGRLILGTPNVASLEARLFRRWWIGFEVPRHLVVFSRPALERLLVDRGFRISRVRPSLWSYSVPDSLALYLNQRCGSRFWGGRAHRWMHHLLYPGVALSRTLGNWAIVEITAVKPRYEEAVRKSGTEYSEPLAEFGSSSRTGQPEACPTPAILQLRPKVAHASACVTNSASGSEDSDPSLCTAGSTRSDHSPRGRILRPRFLYSFEERLSG